ASGGETPIADSREVFRRINPVLRKRFEEKRLIDVEAYCRKRGIQCDWNEDGDLRTRQRVQGVAQHPRTKDWVWFNQAHLFHLSNLDPDMQEILLDTVGEEGLPRNVYYGDGSPLEEDALAEIRAVLDDCEVVFPWETGDASMATRSSLSSMSSKPMPKAKLVYVWSLRNAAADKAGQYVDYHGEQRYMKSPLEHLVQALNDTPLGDHYSLEAVICDDNPASARDRENIKEYGFAPGQGEHWFYPADLKVQGRRVNDLLENVP
nr:hypothetical protein [Tanacetum cinerariifolium]